jgi:hypothetical protein
MTLPSPPLAAPLAPDWIWFADRRVQMLSGRVELGQGNLAAMLQITAEEPTSLSPARIPNEGFTSGNMLIMAGGCRSASRHRRRGICRWPRPGGACDGRLTIWRSRRGG